MTQKPLARNVVGLIPAAGKATRISPLPFSKELFPIGFQNINGEPRPKAVSHYLLEKFHVAGVTETFIVIRKGKWDIPAYFGDGEMVNMHLGYLMMREPFGPPFTLDQAYPFIRDKMVAFGFPDILCSPDDIFKQLLDRQETVKADMVLALFTPHNPQIMDMVDVDIEGRIHNMFLKPDQTDLRFCWLCAVWSPVFTQFMHEWLEDYRISKGSTNMHGSLSVQQDMTVGAVIQSAIRRGLKVYGVLFPDAQYIDIGTPEDLLKTSRMCGSQSQ